MQGLLLLTFVGMLAVLLYTLRSMMAERVCLPSWAGYPHGMHLNIAIVTMTDTNSKLQNKVKVSALLQTTCCRSLVTFACVPACGVCEPFCLPTQATKWRGRNFDGVLTLTRSNKVHYAKMHGYSYEDASWIVSSESAAGPPACSPACRCLRSGPRGLHPDILACDARHSTATQTSGRRRGARYWRSSTT